MAESISEGTIQSLSRNIGDYVNQDEEIASVETDKIDVAVNAPASGTIESILVRMGDTVNVGQDVAILRQGASPPSVEESTPSTNSVPPQRTTQDSDPKASSATISFPSDQQSPLQKLSGTSVERASSLEPILRTEESQRQSQNSSTQDSPSHGEGIHRGEYRVKMNRMRMRIAERLKESQNSAASLTTFNEVDMSKLISFREKYKEEMLKSYGVKMGFMGPFMKAASLALREVPEVNASIEGPDRGDTIVYRNYVDISVAVATPKGLVTAVIRNCESKSLIELEKAIAAMAKKARDGKIALEDLSGGNFTLSNAGMFGSFLGTPIINLPQTAVLGMYGIKDRPVAVDGKVEIRPMMYLGLTYDHRLLDGREAVRFLVNIKDYIEDPARMLLFGAAS